MLLGVKEKNIIRVKKYEKQDHSPQPFLPKYAAKVIQECRHLASSSPHLEVAGLIYKEISKVLIDFGDAQAAFEAAQKIPDDFESEEYCLFKSNFRFINHTRSEAIYRICISTSFNFKRSEADSMSNHISNTSLKNQYKFNVVKELLKSGDDATAAQAILFMESDEEDGKYGTTWKTLAIIELGIYYYDSQDFYENEETKIKSILCTLLALHKDEPKEQIKSLILPLGIHLINNGKVMYIECLWAWWVVKKTLFVKEDIFSREDADWICRKLGEYALKTNDIAAAEFLLSKIETEGEKYKLIEQLCEKYAEFGLTEKAIEFLHKGPVWKIPDSFRHYQNSISYTLSHILLFEKKDIDKALYVASLHTRDYMYGTLIDKSLELNRPQLAYKILPHIPEKEKSRFEVDILVHLGQLKKAEKVADKHYEETGAQTGPCRYHDIANSYIQLGNWSKARTIYDKMVSIRDTVIARLMDIELTNHELQRLILNRAYEEVLKIANERSNPFINARLAGIFMAIGKENLAIKCAEIKCSENRGKAYHEIILFLLAKGRVNYAIDILKSMPDERDSRNGYGNNLKEKATQEIIKKLLQGNNTPYLEHNPSLRMAINLCKSWSQQEIVIKFLCDCGLHNLALKAIDSFPGIQEESKWKGLLQIDIAKSMLASISPGERKVTLCATEADIHPTSELGIKIVCGLIFDYNQEKPY